MILINRGANNTVVLSLTEKVTLSSPYFLMEMINDTTRKIKRFVLASNQSSYTYRYDQFTITESSTEVLTSGTVELKPTGFWSYKVYEQSSATNLNPDATTSLLEVGKVKVVGTDTTYKEHQNPRTYVARGTGT